MLLLTVNFLDLTKLEMVNPPYTARKTIYNFLVIRLAYKVVQCDFLLVVIQI